MTTTIVPASEREDRNSARRLSFDEPFVEECLALLDRLELGSKTAAGAYTLGVTSCLSAEGVTTVATQTAIAAATHLGLRTVLVDCRISRPAVHRVFGVGLCPGLWDALEDPSASAEVVRPSGVESLSLVTAGTFQKDERGALVSPNMGRLVHELRSDADLVILDLPPLVQGRPIRLGTHLNGVVLVVEAERVDCQLAQRTMAALVSTGITLLARSSTAPRASARVAWPENKRLIGPSCSTV